MDCVQFSHCARVKKYKWSDSEYCFFFQVCAEPLYPRLLLQGWERKIFREYPTYREKKVKRRIKMYRCEICRYVYNPEEGDPDNGMAQGKLFFDDLLDD